jgi:hypothetical protein
MPEMKPCDVCHIDLQKRSYNRHLTSQRHQQAVRAAEPAVAEPPSDDEKERVRMQADLDIRKRSFEQSKAQVERERAADECERVRRRAAIDAEARARRARPEAVKELERVKWEQEMAAKKAIRTAKANAKRDRPEAEKELARARWRAARAAKARPTNPRSAANKKERTTRGSVRARHMDILNLSAGYTALELKKAYRSRSLRTHPDKGGSDEAFRAVNEAYEYVSAR